MLYDLFPYGGKELCLLSFIDIDDERKMAVNKVKVTRWLTVSEYCELVLL